MIWKDLLYFSQGERRALFILLILLTTALVLLFYVDYKQVVFAEVTKPGNQNSTKIIPDKRQSSTGRTSKYSSGTMVELNSADTTELKKIPGIGSVYANRIVKYRELLGGFYTIEQLGEVYGIDEEKFQALSPWFQVDTLYIRRININNSTVQELRKHPYITPRQASAIIRMKQKNGTLTGWEKVLLSGEFQPQDRDRLYHYLDFK